MTDTRTRDEWAERSKVWATTAAQGKSPDDSFNQMIIAAAAIKPGEDVLDIATGTGFVRTEERDLRYKNRVDDLDTYVSNGLKRSFAKKTAGMTDTETDMLKQALFDAWAPFGEDGVVAVPNFARLGLGWKES